MKQSDAARRAKELKKLLRYHDWRYFVLDDPELADVEYDRLFKELQQLEEEFPKLRTADSPTRRVGGEPVEGFAEARHRPPLLSLDNGYEEDEIRDWHGRLLNHLKVVELPSPLVAEPKLDGISCKLIYRDGKLELGATRGNGEIGEDITSNVRTIRSLPLTLREKAPSYLDVRGEVVLGRKEFDLLNAELLARGEKTFANPRNLVGGTLRQLDPRLAASRPMDIVIYAVGRAEGKTPKNHYESLHWLEDLGLPTLRKKACLGSLEEVLQHYQSSLAQRDQFPFEMDGVVIKVNDFEVQESLGFRSRSPRWAIAYKFPARQATTEILSITVQVGRNGTLTPVAQLAPVSLSGVTITSATLHNRDEIKRLGVRIHDTVLIERAGDVIPKVVKVIEGRRDGKEKRFRFPLHCPVCGTAVVSEESEVAVRCPNRKCPGRLRKQIEHFVGRNGMDIEGLGDKLIDQLVGAGLAECVVDLYALKAEDLADLDRMGQKSATKLVEEIDRSRTRPLANFLFALGVPFVGQTVAEAIAQHVQTLDQLLGTTQEELESIHGIGPKAAVSLTEFLHSEEGQKLLQGFRQAGLEPEVYKQRQGGSLEGKTFLFTGTLENLTREGASALVKGRGGRVVTGVSKRLDFLVAGAKAGSKLAKARDLGISVLTPEEFLAMLEGSEAPSRYQ